jgi:hypothetical protein
MSRNDKIVGLIAVAVAAILAYEELFAGSTTSVTGVSGTPNALGVPTAAPVVSASTLATSQAGGGLFGNPSGLGANVSAAQTAIAGPLQELPTALEQPLMGGPPAIQAVRPLTNAFAQPLMAGPPPVQAVHAYTY